LSDVMMPRMNGYDLCKALREDPELRSSRIILMTARTGTTALVEGLEKGADDYVSKPFEFRELEARVAAQIRSGRLEQALAERETRLAAIGFMTSGIVHDLKNPLTSIMAYGELAMNSATDDLAVRIVGEAQRLNRMVQEILDFTGGEPLLQKTSVGAARFLRQVLDPLTLSLGRARISLNVDIELDERLQVELDEARMHRVLENILANARDALLGQRRTVEQPMAIWVKAHREGDNVLIRVADNGPGVPPEIAGSLFEPFRSHGKSSGTGLGLAMARNVMVSHGGTIELQADPPEGGAALLVVLPCRQPEVEVAPRNDLESGTALEA